jgi:thiosulfate dehydrogenase (quinone) large subunit
MKRSSLRYLAQSRPPKLHHSSGRGMPGGQATAATREETERGHTVAQRAGAALRWPFTSRLASPIWLAVRLYLGWFWLQVGIAKLQGDWFTADPIGAIFRNIVAGHAAVPFEPYRGVVQVLLDLGIAPLLTMSFPFLEIAVGLAFLSGVLVVPAAAGAIMLNVNMILSGIAHISFDGKFIAMQLLLILAWRVSSYIGIQALLVRGLQAARSALSAGRPLAAAAR